LSPRDPAPPLSPYTTLFRSGSAERPRGEGGDDLVDVHVGRGARPGLEDVDRKLAVVLTGDDRGGGGADGVRDVPVDDAQVGVDRSEEHTSELQSRGHLVCRL